MEQRIEYERNMNHTYLVCKEIRQENDYELQMLLNNRIPGLLTCRLEKVDGKADLYYEITSKQPLKRLYDKRKMNYESLKMLFLNLRNVILKMEEFLLSIDTIIMNPELIYVDVEKEEFYFCAIPGVENDQYSLQKLLEFLLDCIDYEDEKAVATAYEWYKKSGEENSSFLSIYRETFEIRYNKEQNVTKNEETRYIKTEPDYDEKQQNKPYWEIEDSVQELQKEDRDKMGNLLIVIKDKWMICVIILGIAICFAGFLLWKGDIVNITTIGVGALFIVGGYIYHNKARQEDMLSDELDLDELLYDEDNLEHIHNPSIHSDSPVLEQRSEKTDKVVCREPVYGETVFFKSEQMKEIRKLEPQIREFPEFTMELFPFILGKLRGAVDGVIEHETVSRIHCKIELEEGQYYITDLNSTNGTIVNEEVLNTNERRKLQPGDEIRMGQAVYMFR